MGARADSRAAGLRRRLAAACDLAAHRRPLFVVVIVLAVFLFAGFLVWKARTPSVPAPPTPPPTVTFLVPGTRAVADAVSAVGTIHARRDMPVGVVGEGGMIVRIHAEAGDRVASGQVLAEIDSAVEQAQLQQLQANILQARADAKLAEAELQRAAALTERGFISKADIERKTATRDAAAARVAIAEAQAREMRERLNRLSIRSPEAGVVLARNVERGQIVSPASGALYRIAGGGELEVRAEIAEQDLSGVEVGQKATVTPSGSTEGHAGRVWLVEPLIDPGRRQGLARILLPAGSGLHPGGFANVRIERGSAPRPVVPQSALLSDRDGSFVFTIGADDVAHRIAVRAGASGDHGVAIVAGLDGSERVVRSAGAFLEDGEKVTPVPAAPAVGQAATAAAAD